MKKEQMTLFCEKEYKNNNEKIEFIHLESVLGSGYEAEVAKLALEDGVAYRAARKNMQIHSAIILKINDELRKTINEAIEYIKEHQLVYTSQYEEESNFDNHLLDILQGSDE